MSEIGITVIVFAIGVLCLVCAGVIALVDHCHRKRSLRRMYDMLQSAMDGTFRADTYDESLHAAVENKLAEYIAASELTLGKAAQEKEQIKTLIADISHQTKTPLSSILLYTELLKEQYQTTAEAAGRQSASEGQSADAREIITLLDGQAKKLNFLIGSLVKMSRLETGILVLHPKKSSVMELLTAAERQYRDRAQDRGLYLRVMAQEAQGVTACFDEKWTLEALGNLIDNAMKYTPSGGVTVRVKPFGLYVCIEVADTGIGIAEAEHAEIFGRFYRSPKVSGQEGAGIGLYLAREIVTRQSGYMKLVSEEGKGAVFSIYLPAGPAILTKLS